MTDQISQKESHDGVNRIVPNRLIILGLSKTTIGDIGRKIHPTDICRETSPEIIYQERLFFGRHCAKVFVIFTNARR